MTAASRTRSTGCFILLLTAIRLIWVYFDGTPNPLPMSPVRFRLYRAVHVFLYLGIVMMAVNGLAMIIGSDVGFALGELTAADIDGELQSVAAHAMFSKLFIALVIAHIVGVVSYQLWRGRGPRADVAVPRGRLTPAGTYPSTRYTRSKSMNVLAIESSCDETAAAVVVDGRVARSSIVASQVDLHAKYGGIVPEVASRQHLLNIVPVMEEALSEADMTLDDIDAVAATRGPGLVGSLLVGYSAGKALAYARGLPFLSTNHLEGHVYANWLVEDEGPQFPALCLVVSGGHTDFVLMESHGEYRRLGGTRDDAAGEAFDKAGRLLGLGYPGGPAVSKLAATSGPSDLKLPRAWMPGTFDLSFSGLKTAVLHTVRAGEYEPAQIAWEFQESVVDVLAGKTTRLARELEVAEVLVAGGVAANDRLREELQARCPVPVRIPPPVYCTDNAAMIGAAAGHRLALGETSDFDEDVFSTNDWDSIGSGP